VKQLARGVWIQAFVLLLGTLAAACVLQPSVAGPIRIAPETQSPDEYGLSGIAAERPIRLGKDVSRVEVEPHLAPLPVLGFPDAVVAEPWEAKGPRPVVVVLHGLGDRPETHCEAWRTITGSGSFVLCPRGEVDAERSMPGRVRYTLPGGPVLRAHIDAALAALSNRYGDRADTSRPLLVGFSLGATEAALLAQGDPEVFPRVAVVEGGLDVWVDPTIGPFVARGGRRVLFGCGSSWCTPPARAAAARIDGASAGSRVAFADVGHHDAPELQKALMAELAWFVDGDARWSGIAVGAAGLD
jgi:dienelactone hydrolase